MGEYSAFKTLQGWLDEAKLDVEWEVITAEQYPVILQTRLASGNDLPDIVKVHTLDDAALLALAEQGLIIPINEIIDKYSAGPAREAFNKTFPSVRPLTTAEDGNMYWFCHVQNKYYGDNNDANGSFSILYRRDRADALEIDEPENLEEFGADPCVISAPRTRTATGSRTRYCSSTPAPSARVLRSGSTLPRAPSHWTPNKIKSSLPGKTPMSKHISHILTALSTKAFWTPPSRAIMSC